MVGATDAAAGTTTVSIIGRMTAGRRAKNRSRVAAAMVLPAPLSLRELVVVVPLLGALAAVAFGPHVAQGGLYNDDWSFNSSY